jgi:AcrR family transcriptional regulator
MGIMARKADAEKKPALLERIVDHLIDTPLSTLTFRTLASALGVSTYTLVYHFGTRAELVRDVIGAIATRQRGFESIAGIDELTIDSYFAAMQHTFDRSLLPRNRALQRLEFEAQMLESLEPGEDAVTREAREQLETNGRNALVSLGLSDEDATIESRLLIDTFYGIQVGLVVNGDDARATEAFDRAIENHRERVLKLVDRPARKRAPAARPGSKRPASAKR